MARVNSDGTLDGTFGSDGKLTLDYGSSQEEGRAIAVQADGKIVLAGYSYVAATEGYDFLLTRLNSNGTLDPSIPDGKITTHFANSGVGSEVGVRLTYDNYAQYAGDLASSLIIQPDGKIVVGGKAGTINTGIDFAVAQCPLTPPKTTRRKSPKIPLP